MPEVVILSALPINELRPQRETDACGAIEKPIAAEDLAQELERCIPIHWRCRRHGATPQFALYHRQLDIHQHIRLSTRKA